MSALRFKESIAGAVSREVERIAAHPQLGNTEGAAYKAAWDRAGSHCFKHCQALDGDVEVMSLLMRERDGGALVPPDTFARYEAGRGPRR
jgi:hypothetical protein